jgi:ketosteroid isomerase-like protein
MTTIDHSTPDCGLTEDEVLIRRVVTDFADAWNRHDPTAGLATFADDVDHVDGRNR